MLYAIAAVVILILDQAVKFWTNTNLALGASQSFIPGFVDLQYVQNTGAAFGLLSGGTARWFFVGLSVIFTIVIIVLLRRDFVTGKLGRWMLVGVLAGGLGNCIDRAINGYVVDMFHFMPFSFPVFNVADIFISVCGLIFCVWFIFHKEPPKKIPAAPTRPMPRATQRPTKGPDYLEQLQKPIVEARAAIKTETAARRPQPLPVTRPTDGDANWNLPDNIAFSPSKAAIPPVESDPFAEFMKKPVAVNNPATPRAPVSTPRKAPAAPAAPKKGADELSLESILAEFGDK